MIGRAIKKRREELGLSQEQLSKMLGVGKTSISNYEKNVSSPKETVMIQLFDALKCDANYLYQDFLKNTEITSHEQKVIEAYRNHPKMRPAVDRLLNIQQDDKQQIRKLSEEEIAEEILRLERKQQEEFISIAAHPAVLEPPDMSPELEAETAALINELAEKQRKNRQ